MTQGVKDKVVVITGASSRLGEAAARRLAKDGAKLVLGARRIDQLQALAKELSLGDDAIVQTDVSRYDEVKTAKVGALDFRRERQAKFGSAASFRFVQSDRLAGRP